MTTSIKFGDFVKMISPTDINQVYIVIGVDSHQATIEELYTDAMYPPTHNVQLNQIYKYDF